MPNCNKNVENSKVTTTGPGGCLRSQEYMPLRLIVEQKYSHILRYACICSPVAGWATAFRRLLQLSQCQRTLAHSCAMFPLSDAFRYPDLEYRFCGDVGEEPLLLLFPLLLPPYLCDAPILEVLF
jgi:hypothetical protein